MTVKFGDVIRLNDLGLHGVYIGAFLDIVNIDRRYSSFWEELKGLNVIQYCFLTFISRQEVQKEELIKNLNITAFNIEQREKHLLEEMIGDIDVKFNIKDELNLFLLKCQMMSENIKELLSYVVREECDLKKSKEYYAKEIRECYKLFIEARQGDIFKSPFNGSMFVYKGIKSLSYKLLVNSIIPTVLDEIYVIDAKGQEIVLDFRDFMTLERVGHTEKYKNEMYKRPKNPTDKVYRDFSHIKKDFVIYEGI